MNLSCHLLIPVHCLVRILKLREGSVGKMGWAQKKLVDYTHEEEVVVFVLAISGQVKFLLD